MNFTRSIKITFGGILLVTGASTLVFLHLDNVRMRHRIADHRQQYQGNSLLEENAQLKKLIESHARNADVAAAGVHVQLQQTRIEVAALEKSAEQRHAEKVARDARLANMLATNRDPTQGLVRLENFQESGQATPADALKTLVWAAMKGDEAALAKVISMPTAMRTRAEALIARLPEDAKARWTPEKLAALWVSQTITDLSAVQITDETFTDSEHAVVTVRTPTPDEVENIKFKRSESGWKAVLPGNAIEKLGKNLAAGK